MKSFNFLKKLCLRFSYLLSATPPPKYFSLDPQILLLVVDIESGKMEAWASVSKSCEFIDLVWAFIYQSRGTRVLNNIDPQT